MKKIIIGLLVLSILVLSVGLVTAKQQCTTIQDGGLEDSVGNPISIGYDQFGYNYQAHMFNGRYCDYDRVAGGPFCDVNLMMKWNDAWLSNQDCDSDTKLDRHNGFPTYIGSGAWLTNHDTGVNEDGSTWTYFVKIIAVPADATKVGVIWYAADSTEIGHDIWGSFAVIQQVVTGNPPADFITEDGWPLPGDYNSPAGPGFGKW
ncbi:hypothetical protein HYW20_02000 [Candidatus Woesearchaeota archaeon]|nr:hypothetical protein [Candidatus Woesearchaeota archaeon]